MYSSSRYRCRFCGRSKFKSNLGLDQHQKTNKNCLAIQASFEFGNLSINKYAGADTVMVEIETQPPPVAGHNEAVDELMMMEEAMGWYNDSQPLLEADDNEDAGNDDDNGFNFGDETEAVPTVGELRDNVIDCGSDIPSDSPELDLVKEFRAYCEFAENNTMAFNKEEQFSIRLLSKIYEKGAPLEMYETVMEMVYKREGTLREGKSLRDVPMFTSRQRIFDKLANRYRVYPKENRDEVKRLKNDGEKNIPLPGYFIKKRVFLPHRQIWVDVFTHNFREQMIRLLTDPRLLDTHWDFFENNPLSPPPAEWREIGNCPTGRAYRCTYKDLVNNPGKETLFGLEIYMDLTATATFSNLDYHGVKFSLSNFTENVSNW